MRFYRFCFFFTLLVINLSCSQWNKEKHAENVSNSYLNVKPTFVSINMNDKENVLPFDSLFELTSFVKLETIDDNLIGNVGDLLFIKNNIIVADFEHSKSITVYDNEGHFLNKISNIGQGPQEYVNLKYITTTPDQNAILLTDNANQKVMTFDVNGNFINSQKMPFWVSRCDLINNDTWIYERFDGMPVGEKGNRPRIVVSNLNGDILFSNFQTDQTKNFHYGIMYPLKKFEGNIFYMPAFNDTIFHINSKGIAPYYQLSIKRKEKIEEEDKINDDVFAEKLNRLSAYFNGDFLECRDYAIFDIVEPHIKWQRFAIYAKDRKKTFYCNGTYWNDTRLRFSAGKRFLYKDNIFVTCVFPTDIIPFKKEMYRLCKTKTMKKEIDRLYENLTEDDNPVLFFYRIKI